MLTEKERNWLVIWTEYASKPGPLQARAIAIVRELASLEKPVLDVAGEDATSAGNGRAARIADDLATRARREGGADTAVIRPVEAEAGVRGELPDESGGSLPLFPS
jgi:hypothetical protein